MNVFKPRSLQASTGCTQENRNRSHTKRISVICQSIDEPSSRRFPKARTWDHAIDLKPNAKPYAGKAYSLDNNQKEALQDIHFRNLDKGYIRPSTSPWAAPFFCWKKRTASYAPAKIIDASMNKRSRISTHYH